MWRAFMLCGLLIAAVENAKAAESSSPATSGFSFQDDPGQHLDILLDGRIVGRYMYAHDTSSSASDGDL